MSQTNRRILWCILLIYQMSAVRLAPRHVVMPDSTEMYAYKEPRSMNDLRMQHMRQAMNDVSDTITEVQRILRKDPSLPRLTRGEIEDLFEMVAREEYKRSLEAGDFERAKHMRSLMLVLPYNTNLQSEERLEVSTWVKVVRRMIQLKSYHYFCSQPFCRSCIHGHP